MSERRVYSLNAVVTVIVMGMFLLLVNVLATGLGSLDHGKSLFINYRTNAPYKIAQQGLRPGDVLRYDFERWSNWEGPIEGARTLIRVTTINGIEYSPKIAREEYKDTVEIGHFTIPVAQPLPANLEPGVYYYLYGIRMFQGDYVKNFVTRTERFRVYPRHEQEPEPRERSK